jgi:hypothetical protein
MASGFGNTVSGDYSAAFGQNNNITGTHAFAFGEDSEALGNYAFALGRECQASANYAFAFGKNAISSQLYAFALGKYAKSTSASSFAIGTYVNATNQYAFAIGKGNGYSNRLENDIENSLMIGFSSEVPTFFVEPAPANGLTGRIGIGNITAPQAKLHILGDSDASRPDNASIYIQSAGNYYSTLWMGDTSHYIKTKPNEDLVFKAAGNDFLFKSGNVGIGTDTPIQTLDIEGTMRVSALASAIQKMLVTTADGTLATTDIPADDNMGNHTATQNINLNGKYLSGDGSNEGVFINTAGKVGIGISTPSQTLDVEGTMRVSALASATQKMLVTTADGTLATTDIPADDNMGNHTATQNINLNGKYLSGDGDSEGIYINSLGKIGIGTNAPAAKIQINGSGNDVLGRFISGSNSLNIGRAISGAGLEVWGTTYMGFNIRRDGDNQWKTEYDGASNGAAMIYGTSGGDLVFTCIGNDDNFPQHQQLTDQQIKVNAKMILRSNGLLKINEAVVKANVWSDYVFHQDYILPHLTEVEDFINKNQHLPDVPSEAEVMEQGINLGEMDAILLKKIEELTLYVIELKKENKAMQETIENLKK